MTNETLLMIQCHTYICLAHLGKGYGMPSSHAQFIWFFAIYGSLYLSKNIKVDHVVEKIVVLLAMFSLAVAVCYSR